MQPSIFNTRVPLSDEQVFLMNTFTDAQVVVSSDVEALLDRLSVQAAAESLNTVDSSPSDPGSFTEEERSILRDLHANGFVVDSRRSEREAMNGFFLEHRNTSDELHVTLLTTHAAPSPGVAYVCV